MFIHTCNKLFKFQNIDEETVTSIIDKLSPNNSCGFDGISTKLIKQSKHIFIKPLAIIINQILNTGIFPDQLKVAKGYRHIRKMLKPFLLTIDLYPCCPQFPYFFEKSIFNQLYQHFKISNLFYNTQYGFRSEHSTEFAAYELIDT